uniref:C2H2-type domain-containing protein n=1 Tax=Oryza glumipatula TaxID=40148 RepID=A0A0E0B325_9ORYZ
MEFPTAGGSRFADGHMNNNNGFVQAVAGDPLAVVRDALLSQLQHDRLRQEIIVAELAKIERAMALRDASPSPSPTPRHAAGKTAASQTWSCAVCEVQTSSERNLRDHYGGQKHQSKVAGLELKAKTATVKTTAKPSPVAGQRAHAARWSCSVCQVHCNGEWHFDTHLKGKRHQANTQALLEQSNKNSGNSESHDGTKAQPSNVSHHAEKKKRKEEEEEATWICRACQAVCTCESDLQNHLRGRRHQLKVQALPEAAKQEKNNPPKLAKNPNKQPSEWVCSLCQAKCNSESQLEHHRRSTRHQQKVESLGWNAKESDLGTLQGMSSDGSSSKSVKISATMDKQKATYFCEVCSLKCTSQRMLADHLSGRKHIKQLELQLFS